MRYTACICSITDVLPMFCFTLVTSGSGSISIIIIAVVASVIVILVVILVAACVLYKRHRNREKYVCYILVVGSDVYMYSGWLKTQYSSSPVGIHNYLLAKTCRN